MATTLSKVPGQESSGRAPEKNISTKIQIVGQIGKVALGTIADPSEGIPKLKGFSQTPVNARAHGFSPMVQLENMFGPKKRTYKQ